MYLARIEGRLTSTVKHRSLQGCSLLVARRIGPGGSPEGEPQVLIDQLGADRGVIVLVSTDGDLARRILSDNTTPARLVVVGIVDSVSTFGS
jgi:ethanolamine utilization protein EutN